MYIQMVTALVLQLIQCVVHLPSAEKDSNSDEELNKKVRKLFSKNSVILFGAGIIMFLWILYSVMVAQ